MTLVQVYNKISKLPTVIPKWVDESILSLDDQIIDANIQQMEEFGQDSDGKEFGDYADRAYAMQKALEGKESRFINLNFDGDFHSGMFIEMNNGGFNISSKDSKTPILTKHWGENIFGLNEKNMEWLLDEITEYLTIKLTTYFS